MRTKIYRYTSLLGMCNSYLIEDEGNILIDTGMPKQGKKFIKWLKDLSINPRDISLLILTHGHFDHIGSASDIKKLTGCKVTINNREKDWVEQIIKPIPPGVTLWSKILEVLFRMYVPFISFPGTYVDLPLKDDDFSLKSYGIKGRVMYTPGHTSGSSSILLDTGDTFVGDLVNNGLPLRIGAGMPVYAENNDTVRKSLRLLLCNGAKRIYPGHGKPFKADLIEKFL